MRYLQSCSNIVLFHGKKHAILSSTAAESTRIANVDLALLYRQIHLHDLLGEPCPSNTLSQFSLTSSTHNFGKKHRESI